MAKWYETPRLWYSDKLNDTVYEWIDAQGIDKSNFDWITDFITIRFQFRYKKDLTWFLLSHSEVIDRIQCSGMIGIEDDSLDYKLR